MLIKEGTERYISDAKADLADLHVNNGFGYYGLRK